MIKTPKTKILVSFSGGETSAFMINWLLKNKPEHEYRFIFANTGEENEETLLFTKQVQDYFGIDLVWVEYKRLSYREVNYETAYRSHSPEEIANGWKNHPFRDYIRDFGIPSMANPSCTRELKEYPISRYISENGWKPRDYSLAIGIRSDELGRVGQYYYPLIGIDATKPMVNAFWDKMPFRLQLRGYEGNCKVCYKKSMRKLITIARYNPERFAFFKCMEDEFENYVPDRRQDHLDKMGKKIVPPFRFFRGNKTVSDIFEMAKDSSIEDAIDDSRDKNYQMSIYHDGTELDVVNGCVESCNAFN